MGCRVAFERGKERLVLLMVASSGASGHLLLAEALPTQKEAIVRVTAPLAGCRVWLHVVCAYNEGMGIAWIGCVQCAGAGVGVGGGEFGSC